LKLIAAAERNLLAKKPLSQPYHVFSDATRLGRAFLARILSAEPGLKRKHFCEPASSDGFQLTRTPDQKDREAGEAFPFGAERAWKSSTIPGCT
jgi:hypothetical protein